MHLTQMWHPFLADAGNAPGAQNGDVLITLLTPVGGVKEAVVPTGAVNVAAEGGNLIGIQLVLPDGRHLFVPSGNIAGIIDAPKKSAAKKPDDKAEEKPEGEDDGKAEEKASSRRAGAKQGE